ncbi:MAG TPA: CHAP domain-containing protein [Azospirillum sp.]|nr:CHAP domain-containing protein [Azospirillum sp.]
MSPVAIPSANAFDCVRVVRSISDFTLQGDAWMWWNRAAGQYARDNAPAAGSVLVFKRSGRLGRGHVSLVSKVIDRRTIEVDHSWLDGRGLRRGMRVIDVSQRNDWSMVRVWHEPSDQMGMRVYPTYGFILPSGAKPRHQDPEPRYVVSPPGRSVRGSAKMLVAKAPAPATVLPGHKPALVSVGGAYAMRALPVDTVLPSRKPSRGAVATSTDGKPCPLPGRKPGQLVAQVASRGQ